MKTSSVFYLYKIKSIFKSKLFWLDGLLMLFLSAFSYLTRTKFFSPAGTSSLSAYFSFVPFISIIVIPALCLKKENAYDDFVPLSIIKKTTLNFSAHISAFFALNFLLLWMPVFVNFYGDIDLGSCIISFLALLFYGTAAIALCFFISECFEKSIAAFVVSAFVLAFSNYIHLLPQYFSLPGFLTDFCYSISFVGRFDSASKGIFSSTDFLFYLLISFLFLMLAILVSENKKGRHYSKKEFRINIYVFTLLFLLFANNERFCIKGDFSKDKIFSISSYTKKFLAENSETWTVHYFKSRRLESLYPSVKNVQSFLKDYCKAGKNISLEIIECDKDENARKLLNTYGIYPQRIRTENSTSTEFIDVYSSIVLEASGSIEVIPFVVSPESLEYQLDTKFLKLAYSFEPEVQIICANGMTLEDDLRLLNDWFLHQDIKVRNINLLEMEMNGLSGVGPIFVFGEELLDEQKVRYLEDYVKDGKGNVLFFNTPWSVNLKDDWALYEHSETYVTDLLSEYGLYYKPSLVFDFSCQRINMMSEEDGQNFSEIINYPMWLNVLPQKNTRLGVNVFWTSPLEIPENGEILLASSQYSYEENFNFENENLLIETNPFLAKFKNVQTNALQNSIIAAFVPVKCNDNVHTKQGFYLISDENFASYWTNGFIGGEQGDFRNFIFLTGLFWKMNGNEALYELQSKTSRDTTLYKRKAYK